MPSGPPAARRQRLFLVVAAVVAAALFAAMMFVGSDSMSRALGVPSFIADVTVALSLLTMLVALLFTAYRIRR